MKSTLNTEKRCTRETTFCVFGHHQQKPRNIKKKKKVRLEEAYESTIVTHRLGSMQ